MGATDRAAEVRELVAQALLEQAKGLDYGYDVGPALVPRLDRGDVVGGYLVTISRRSPVLSPPRLSISIPVEDGWPTPELISEAVRNCVNALKARALQLREQHAKASRGLGLS
jgi:hypothetical protein